MACQGGNREAWYAVGIALVLILLSPSCASLYHRVIMKGSIIEISNSEIFLCIGKKDGAAVGQVLNVYKIVTFALPPPKPSPEIRRFKREYTGKVRITEIIDEHFAKAVVISGNADTHSIVELPDP